MDINRSIYYGFNGQRDDIPRIPRSATKRENCSSEEESAKVTAFDLLATLASTLLHEGKSFSAPSSAVTVNNKHIFHENFEKEDTDIAIKQPVSRNLCELDIDKPDSSPKIVKHMYKRIKFVHGKSSISECISTVTNSSSEDKTMSSTKPSVNVPESTLHKVMKGDSLDFGNSLDYTTQNTVKIQSCSDREEEEDGDVTTMADTSDSFCKQLIMDRGIDISTIPQNITPNSTFPTNLEMGNKVKGVENSSHNRLLGVKLRPFKQSTHVIGRRVKRLFQSKSWKVSTRFKKRDISRVAGCGMGASRTKMKTHKTRKKYRTDVVSADKKLCDPTAEDGSSRESFVCFPEKEFDIDGGRGGKDMAVGGQASLPSNSSHVKLNIKSFRVPEVSIEVPKTATIGHLKRVVMAAVLGREYHIGVILGGAEVGDDDRTLVEMGIRHRHDADGLGFSLHPCSSEPFTPPPHPPSLRHCCDPGHIPTSFINTSLYSLQQPTAVSGVDASGVPAEGSPTDTLGNYSESNTRISSPTEVLTHNSSVSDSRALITLPSAKADGLSLVPINHHTRRSDRRIRRPFSVYEVEALVQAVEEIGTGRWRDVKLSAFENAGHRTYVDLKDKWKTLVHTASISPHQRRGEPVPQQLLDRVLRAHAEWSTQQHGLKQEAMADLGSMYHQEFTE